MGSRGGRSLDNVAREGFSPKRLFEMNSKGYKSVIY